MEGGGLRISNLLRLQFRSTVIMEFPVRITVLLVEKYLISIIIVRRKSDAIFPLVDETCMRMLFLVQKLNPLIRKTGST